MAETIVCSSLGQLDTIAEQLIAKYPESRLIAFYGSMGAGKTTFIKTICSHLQVTDVVNSPTFAIVNEYLRKNGDRIYHFDLYRLKSLLEMFDIGYEDYFYSGRYCLIEWPEKIEELLPAETIRVKIALSGDGDDRLFTF